MSELPVAIVTGGGRAIGRRISLELARAGHDLVVAGPIADEIQAVAGEIRASGRQALPLIVDVTREEQVQEMAARTLAEYGRVDVLVNNAGIIGPTAPVTEVQRGDWDEVLAVNLTGPYLCAKAVLPAMIARRAGKIVNISSIAGQVGYALRSPYCASKWGLIGLTLTLAKEVGGHNIQVNAVCPGPVAGSRMQRIIEKRAAELGRTVDDMQQEYVDTTLLKRFVREEDVAALVVYLASPAGDNITGQTLGVTAGYGLG
jgi:NAD(P)-dependent dehydrogenase (short-subunit alcohol dehydrogenase family)